MKYEYQGKLRIDNKPRGAALSYNDHDLSEIYHEVYGVFWVICQAVK